MTTPRTKAIAISRQRGSGGSRVGRMIADRLGYRYIDRELLRLASEYLRTSTEDAATPPSSWWSRLSDAFASGGADGGYTPSLSDSVYEGELFDIEQRLLGEIVDEQDAVIVGRGAAQQMRGRPGVVSVFLHAPDIHRLARVQSVYQLRDEKAARRAIDSSDADRARFIHSLTDADWTDARLYDLTVDTASAGLERTAELIIQLAR